MSIHCARSWKREAEMADRCGFVTGGVFTANVRFFAEQLPSTRLVQKPFGGKAIRELVQNLMT